MYITKRDLLEEIQVIDSYEIRKEDKNYFKGRRELLKEMYDGEFNYSYLKNKKRWLICIV